MRTLALATLMIGAALSPSLFANETENTTYENLQDAVKAVWRVKFIAIQVYLKKQEKSQINNLTLPKQVGEKRQISPKSAEGRK